MVDQANAPPERGQRNKSDTLWYPRYPGDYQRKTSHLSLTQHGVYVVLLDHYYATGRPLPANAMQVQRICRAFDQHEVDAMHEVLRMFFVEKPDGYHNQRADEELLKRQQISEKRSNAANARHSRSDSSDEIKGSKRRAKADANAPANAHTTTTTTTELIGGDARTHASEVSSRVLDLIPRGHQVASLVGGSWQIVESWLNAGADPERDIYPTVERLLQTEPAPNTLKYFSKAIGRATQTRLQSGKDIADAAPNSGRTTSSKPRPLSGFAAAYAKLGSEDHEGGGETSFPLLHSGT